jgi:hypothetical protein
VRQPVSTAAYQDSGGGDLFAIDVSTNGGGTWTNELSWDENHWNPGEIVNLDLAAYAGQAAVQVRFRYLGNAWDWWAEIDDVSLNCDLPPEINVGPISLETGLEPDTVGNLQLTIENSGGQSLNWSIFEDGSASRSGMPAGLGDCSVPVDIPWLSVAPDEGITPPAGSTLIDVTFDSTGLGNGMYTGAVCIASTDPATPLVQVPVSLAVGDPVQLLCNGATVDFESGIPIFFTTAAAGNPDVKWVTTANDAFCGGTSWSGANETPGSGEAACVDADLNNPLTGPYDAQMITNSFDLSLFEGATLAFAAAYRDQNVADRFEVDVSPDGGGAWINELSWDENHWNPGEIVNIDLAAYLGLADVLVRFRYSGDAWDWWAEVDDLSLSCVYAEGISSDGFEDIIPP